MVIDTFSYNGEADILEIRLNCLDEHVDQFIIVECPTTFCGQRKPLHFEFQKDRFTKWLPKIKYFVVDEEYTDAEIEQAFNSPYTQGNPRWAREFLQKEAIKKAMTHLNDEDTCYVGDVDEIWEHREPNGIEKLKLHVYAYYLNLLSTEEFWGTVRAKWKDLKDKCFNDVRNDITKRTTDFQGIHLTNQGGKEALRQKVIDQYNPEVLNSELLLGELDRRFGVADYAGRDFTFHVDETSWPKWLKDNKKQFEHLCKM